MNADNYYFNCQGVYKFNLCNQLLKINFDGHDSQRFEYVFRAVVFSNFCLSKH